MSSRSEPKPCTCRFCGEAFTSAGIRNHETWCDQNPNRGVHPDDAPALFNGTDGSPEDSAGSDSNPDPDQRDSGGTSLPDRSVLSGDNKSSTNGLQKCPHCSSTHTVPAAEALQEVKSRVSDPDPAILGLFEDAARYCNECFACYAGSLEHPTLLAEVAA